jgi:hypothetical protein
MAKRLASLPEQTRNVARLRRRSCQLYGYRAWSRCAARGLRFNPNKPLIDPYARDAGRRLGALIFALPAEAASRMRATSQPLAVCPNPW